MSLSSDSVSHPYLSSYLSSLSSFSWPCEMATVICTSVLVMKQKIHSVAAWRFLCWSVDQVKLWQRKPQCTFPHCSARTVCTFSHVYFPRWAPWSFVHCTHSRKMFYTRFFFFFQKQKSNVFNAFLPVVFWNRPLKKRKGRTFLFILYYILHQIPKDLLNWILSLHFYNEKSLLENTGS